VQKESTTFFCAAQDDILEQERRSAETHQVNEAVSL
jgi:hypothetical protein